MRVDLAACGVALNAGDIANSDDAPTEQITTQQNTNDTPRGGMKEAMADKVVTALIIKAGRTTKRVIVESMTNVTTKLIALVAVIQ